MDRLSAQPEELIVKIIESIESLKDVASVCAVSKQLCRIGKPVLYSTIKINGRNGNEITRCIQLMCSVGRDPSLATMMKELSIRVKSEAGVYFGDDTEHEVFSPSPLASVLSGISDHESELFSWWEILRGAKHVFPGLPKDVLLPYFITGFFMLHLQAGITDLSLLVEVGTSEISRQMLRPMFGLADFDSWGLPTTCPLWPQLHGWARNVKRLTLTSENVTMLSLGFEKLQTLKIDLVNISHDSAMRPKHDLEVTKEPLSHPELRTLALKSDWSELSPEFPHNTVSTILENVGAPLLKVIKFKLTCSPSRRTLFPRGDFDFLIQNLETTGSTLEVLDIGLSSYQGHFDIEYMRNFLPIKSLADFTQLKVLILPREAILRAETGLADPSPDISTLFPPSLEHLVVSHPDGKFLYWLRNIERSGLVSHLYNLKTITLACGQARGHLASWFRKHLLVVQGLRMRGIDVRVEDVYTMKDHGSTCDWCSEWKSLRIHTPRALGNYTIRDFFEIGEESHSDLTDGGKDQRHWPKY
jgi:hypothetical protein